MRMWKIGKKKCRKKNTTQRSEQFCSIISKTRVSNGSIFSKWFERSRISFRFVSCRYISKYISIIPLKTKQIPDVSKGIETAIQKMGGKPETIYSDNEGAFVSNEIF